MDHEGRVLRVIVCTACRWQYGAMWVRAEVYSYWGDCPKCGGVTTAAAHYLPELGTAAAKRLPAQMSLGF